MTVPRPEMPHLDELRQIAAELRAGGAGSTAESRAATWEAVARAAEDVVGTASDAEGRITATWDAGGMAGLELSPTAMRLPSMDLAEQVVAVTGRARADYERQRLEALAQASPLGGLDLGQVMGNLDRAQSALGAQAGQLQAAMEQLAARLPR